MVFLSEGRTFGEAFCERFGLNPKDVGNLTLHATTDEILHVSATIFVNADDLEAIALRMKDKESRK